MIIKISVLLICIILYYIITRTQQASEEEGFTLQSLYNRNMRYIRYNAPSPVSTIITTIMGKVKNILA